VILLAALLTSLLSPSLLSRVPFGQEETEQKAAYVRARIVVRLEEAELSALELYLIELQRSVPRYGRFHPQVKNLHASPLGAARRERFDLCLGLYESEILDLKSRLALVAEKPWTVQGGECYSLVRGGKALPLDSPLAKRIYLPDPISVPRFAAVLATWRRAFGSSSFDALRKVRVRELLPNTSIIRETLKRDPEEVGFLRLFPDQILPDQQQILLLLCAGISKESTQGVAGKALLEDLFRRLNQPEILAKIFRRQGYLGPSRAQEIQRFEPVSSIDVEEARDLWLRGPLPGALTPGGTGDEFLTTVLLFAFGGGVLFLLIRSLR
jgi:hypothetical protein